MLRQVSSRNQRAKGFKGKHALQICVLVAVSVWLLYQVKHSHDKKITFDERNSEILEVEERHSQIFKLGRKDLPDVVHKDPEPETGLEGEEKEEAKEVDKEVKQEESEDGEGRDDGDEMIDEHDQEGADIEEEEKINDEESKDGLGEESDLSATKEHEEGSHEARERTFKGDDASSAVMEDIQAMGLESKSGGARNLDELISENLESKEIESEIIADGAHNASNEENSSIVELKDDSKADEAGVLEKKELFSNDNLAMNPKNRESEMGDSKLDTASNTYSTLAEANNQMEQQSNPATAYTVAISNQMEVPLSSTATTGSGNHMERQGNASMVKREAVGLPSNKRTSVYQNATVELETPGEDSFNSENMEMEQIDKSMQEKSGDSFITSTNYGDTTLGESGNTSHNVVNGEVNDSQAAASTLQNI